MFVKVFKCKTIILFTVKDKGLRRSFSDTYRDKKYLKVFCIPEKVILTGLFALVVILIVGLATTTSHSVSIPTSPALVAYFVPPEKPC